MTSASRSGGQTKPTTKPTPGFKPRTSNASRSCAPPAHAISCFSRRAFHSSPTTFHILTYCDDKVPDVGRTPNLLNQSAHTAPGQPNNATLQSLAALDYNWQLAQNIDAFKANSSALGVEVDVSIHPTHRLFNFALDNADVLGFTNVTGEWWTG